jgi:SAM-dependent methyltransferase
VTGSEVPSAVPPDDWDTHWDNFADAAGHNPAQAYRRRLVLALLAARGTPQRYLDIGSGQGDLAAEVAGRWADAEIAGIELSARGVELAARKVPRGCFEQFDLLSGQAPPGEFEAWATHATCSEVLEHVDEPEVFLTSARGWLAPGATLIITVPGGPMSAFDRHVGHRRHYTAGELTALLESTAFEVTDCGGAGFPFFNLYRRTVIARGERLVSDVDATSGVPLLARTAMAVFNGLLAATPTRGRRGWQLYAAGTALPFEDD